MFGFVRLFSFSVKVNKWYRVSSNHTVDFFDDANTPQLMMHPENQRHQEIVEEEYVRKILTMGNVGQVRGRPWAIASAGDKPPYKLVSYGTLTRAIYKAAAAEPRNPNVVATLKAGLEGVEIFSHRTPVDVVRWMVLFHNEFHSGSSFSVCEVYKLVEKADSSWTAEAALKGLNVSNQALRQEYVDKLWPSKFQSANVFNEAKATCNILKRLGLKEAIFVMLGSYADFTDASIKNEHVVHCIHACLVVIEKFFQSSLTPEWVRIFTAELVKFTVPLGLAKNSGVEHSPNKPSNSLLSTFVSTRAVPWALNNRDAIKAMAAPIAHQSQSELSEDFNSSPAGDSQGALSGKE
jgi:hypothetical protein